jgi:adenylate cyclase
MAKDRLSGKLAVILHADVAGSTQLVQQDEHLAHERIHDSFRRFSDIIEKYLGKVLELRGDALLAEFERPSDAVSAAIAFQADHADHNSRIKDDLQLKVRVGIAMGEVIVADSTVTGAGVVLAQRVEQLAVPGGLCITEALHEALPKRMPFDLENLGEQVLKGFDDPVRVYRVELRPGESIPQPEESRQPAAPPKTRRLLVVLGTIALIVTGGAAYWLTSQVPQEEPASIEIMAYPLPNEPSIAVLPFTNLSDDAQQEYFADGMTEDLITDISKVSGLFVIARNSVFTYKGKSVKVRQVAEELGVRYVMEGSVRRVGNQVRINAQLIDATTGGHLWADRYDGSLEDIFKLQDRITKKIVTALEVALDSRTPANSTITETVNPDAYDVYLHGWNNYRRKTPANFSAAKKHFEKAVELDPQYSQAFAALAALHWDARNRDWGVALGLDDYGLRLNANAYLEKAKASATALGLITSARINLKLGKALAAINKAKQALELAPADAEILSAVAEVFVFAGDPDLAIRYLKLAMRLDPLSQAYYYYLLGLAEFTLERYGSAVDSLKIASELNTEGHLPLVVLAAALSHLGQLEDASAASKKAESIEGWWVNVNTTILSSFPYKQEIDRLRLADGLRLAGMSTKDAWGN